MSLKTTATFFRGGTLYLESTFYDPDGNIIQPVAAFININFPNPDGSRATEEIQMSPPAFGQDFWTVEINTMNMGTGPLNWSIHSQSPFPVAVDDGSVVLTANSANLVNF